MVRLYTALHQSDKRHNAHWENKAVFECSDLGVVADVGTEAASEDIANFNCRFSFGDLAKF